MICYAYLRQRRNHPSNLRSAADFSTYSITATQSVGMTSLNVGVVYHLLHQFPLVMFRTQPQQSIRIFHVGSPNSPFLSFHIPHSIIPCLELQHISRTNLTFVLCSLLGLLCSAFGLS
ncbi:hypothetical protein CPC08DRAFT_344888 [Agrocybe pediades]|nr:hypothetical protein CPC08DRAFT_344888 [Agrocybe pediades]